MTDDRKAFEAWISAPPFERSIKRKSFNPSETAWPGHYTNYDVQLAWEAYSAGIAAERARTDADAERYRWLREHSKMDWRNGPGLYWYLPRHGEGTYMEQLDAAIDALNAARAKGRT